MSDTGNLDAGTAPATFPPGSPKQRFVSETTQVAARLNKFRVLTGDGNAGRTSKSDRTQPVQLRLVSSKSAEGCLEHLTTSRPPMHSEIEFGFLAGLGVKLILES